MISTRGPVVRAASTRQSEIGVRDAANHFCEPAVNLQHVLPGGHVELNFGALFVDLHRADNFADARMKVLEEFGELGCLAGAQPLGQFRERTDRVELIDRLHQIGVEFKIRHIRIARRLAVVFVARQSILDSIGDLVMRSEQEHTSTDEDEVAESKNSKLAVLAVHPRAVGALQIGEHKMIVVFLDLAMEAADAFVVQLDGISFFAPNRDGGLEICEYSPTICPLDNAKGESGHTILFINHSNKTAALEERRSTSWDPTTYASRPMSSSDGALDSVIISGRRVKVGSPAPAKT